MSSRALFLVLLVGTAPLRAQDRVTQLERRLTILSAKDSALAGRITIRDSAAREAQDLVVIGHAPQFAAVPRWAAAEAGPGVDSVVDAWAAAIGTLYTSLRPDTLRIGFRTDTAGMDRRQLRDNLRLFPATIRYDVATRNAWRLEQLVGWRFGQWVAHQLPGAPARARVDAIIALTKDTTAAGPSCLEGNASACIEVLHREGPLAAMARRSFAAWAIAGRGQDGWLALAQDTLGAPETRLAALAGRPYEAAVADWITSVRTRPVQAGIGEPWTLVWSLAWVSGLLLVALWRIKWRPA